MSRPTSIIRQTPLRRQPQRQRRTSHRMPQLPTSKGAAIVNHQSSSTSALPFHNPPHFPQLHCLGAKRCEKLLEWMKGPMSHTLRSSCFQNPSHSPMKIQFLLTKSAVLRSLYFPDIPQQTQGMPMSPKRRVRALECTHQIRPLPSPTPRHAQAKNQKKGTPKTTLHVATRPRAST
jgi:hypothetical protein